MKIKKTQKITNTEELTKRPPLGRPRAFDAEAALDIALELFWRKGYEGTSLTDLTEAMGINRPSLYAAFGNKEALFHKALDRYVEKTGCLFRDALAEPDVRVGVEKLLLGAADAQRDPLNPRGCLLVQGALACSDEAQSIREELTNRRALNEATLCRRFEQAKQEGQLPPSTDCTHLARYISTVLQGMAVQIAGGTDGKELRIVAEIALQAWPKHTRTK